MTTTVLLEQQELLDDNNSTPSRQHPAPSPTNEGLAEVGGVNEDPDPGCRMRTLRTAQFCRSDICSSFCRVPELLPLLRSSWLADRAMYEHETTLKPQAYACNYEEYIVLASCKICLPIPYSSNPMHTITSLPLLRHKVLLSTTYYHFTCRYLSIHGLLQ